MSKHLIFFLLAAGVALHGQTTVPGGRTFTGPLTVGSTVIDSANGITTPKVTIPSGTPLEFGGACMAAASVTTPAAGEYSYFLDSGSSCALTRMDSSRTATAVVVGTPAYSCSVTGVSSVACTHNLNTTTPWVVCFDGSGVELGSTGAATAVTSVVANSVNLATVTFSGVTTGVCSISSGSAGPKGDDGGTGNAGSDGQSVTVTAEGSGANCTYGGQKLVGVSGTSYICNGAPGTGDVSTGGTNTYSATAVNDARSAAHTMPAKTGLASAKPGTCNVGEEYFATDSAAGQNKWLCTALNTWTQQSGGGATYTGVNNVNVTGTTISYDPLDVTQMYMDERWCTSSNANGQYGFSTATTGSGSAVIAASTATDANHPCGIKLSNTTSGQGVLLHTAGNGNAMISTAILQPGTVKPITVEVQFRISSTSNIVFYAGLMNSPVLPGAFNNGCFIRYNTDLGTPDTGWMAVCANAGGTFITGAIAGTLDTNIHRLRMSSSVAGSWVFALDGGAPTTLSAQIPSGSALMPYIWASNATGQTAKTFDLFRFAYKITGLAVN